MRPRGHWGGLLTSRQQQQGAGGLGRCASCASGDHSHCRNRAFDDVLGIWANCHCHYMDHGVRPSQRMVDDIAAPEPEQDAYEKTIGL